jgi:hypothetical protein
VAGVARWQGNLERGGPRVLRGGRAQGCASGAPGSQSTVFPERTVSAPASTAATGDPQLLARQAYLGMWQAFFTASRTADYQSPRLAYYAAGAALELLVQGLYQYHQEGIVTRGTPSHSVAVTMTKTSLKTPEAKVTDCSDSSGSGTYYRSGKPAAGGSPGRQAIYAQVQPFDGTWKVTYLVVEKAGSC